MSKLANALFLFELHRRLRAAGSSTLAVGCHPGFATTELGRHIPGIHILQPPFGLIANAPAMGLIKPGGYYDLQGFKEIRGPSGDAFRAPQATDPEQARLLWEVPVTMTGIDPGLLPSA